MPNKIILYKCKWCNRLKPTIKIHAIDHESYCFKNPKNKACLTCKFFKRRRRTYAEKSFTIGDIYECSKQKLSFMRIEKRKNGFMDERGYIVVNWENGIIQKDIHFLGNIVKSIFPTFNCELHRRKTN